MKKIISQFQPPLNIFIILPVLFIAIAANLSLSYFNNNIIESPLFLDSIFTATTAIIYGPALGILVGILTNIGMEFLYGFTGTYWPFALCSIATAVIIGTMSSRGYLYKNIHITIAILSISLANALIGSVIAYLVYNGKTDVQIDEIVIAFVEMGTSLLSANFWARIPSNLIDKMVTVYFAYGISKLFIKKTQ